MNKQKNNWIWQEDLDKYFNKSKKGTKNGKEYVEVPENIEIYKIPDRQEVLEDQKKKLEEMKEEMTEPTEEELIEQGKESHEYYMLKEELRLIEEQINKLNN